MIKMESGLELEDMEEFTEIEWANDDVEAWLNPADPHQRHAKGSTTADKKKEDRMSEQFFGEISMFSEEQWCPDDDIFVLVDHDYENEERLVRALDKHCSGMEDVTSIDLGRSFSNHSPEVKSKDFRPQTNSLGSEDENYILPYTCSFNKNNAPIPQEDGQTFQYDLTSNDIYHPVTVNHQPQHSTTASSHHNPVKNQQHVVLTHQVASYQNDVFVLTPREPLSSVSSDEGFSEPLPPICSLLPSALQTTSPNQEETEVQSERLKNCKQYLRDIITERVDRNANSSNVSNKKVVEIHEEESVVLTLCEEDSDLGESNDDEPDENWKKNDEELLECRWEGCWKLFSSQSLLVRHIESSHLESPRPDLFPCYWLDCPRRIRPFNARYKLLIHMRVHSGEKPNKCPFAGCKKAFSRLENLKIHQRSHTGERPYLCQFSHCRKAFSNSSDRAKHLRTHFDTKPYACQVEGCSKKYTDPSSLRKHIKNHAGLQYNKPKKLTASKPVVSAAQVQARRMMSPLSNESILEDMEDCEFKPILLKRDDDWRETEIKLDPESNSYDDLNDDIIHELNDSNQDSNLSVMMDSDTENDLLEWTNMDSEDFFLFDSEDILDI